MWCTRRIARASGRAPRVIAGLALVGGLTALPHPGRGDSRSVVNIEPTDDGRLSIDARRAVVADVLQALGAEAGFDVLIDSAPKRPPVNARVRAGSVEDVLREVLRDRNYALVYDNGAVSRVILLEPSGPRAPSRRTVPPRAKAKRKAAARGPTVVRF